MMIVSIYEDCLSKCSSLLYGFVVFALWFVAKAYSCSVHFILNRPICCSKIGEIAL